MSILIHPAGATAPAPIRDKRKKDGRIGDPFFVPFEQNRFFYIAATIFLHLNSAVIFEEKQTFRLFFPASVSTFT